MLKNIIIAFNLALENIRTHFFHTMLSVLGIVIGVTALVAVLSLIDGMQKYAHNQISTTTTLKAINIGTEQYKRSDNVWIKRDTFNIITYPEFIKMKNGFASEASCYMYVRQAGEIVADNQTIGSYVVGTAASFPASVKMAYGEFFTEEKVNQKQPITFINHLLATKLAGSAPLQELLGKKIHYKSREFTIKGILEKKEEQAAEIVIPVTLLTEEELENNPPSYIIEANNVENVSALKIRIEDWLKQSYPATFSSFKVSTNEFRLKQVEQGFLLFRIVMTMIVGISIVVGGIGVMNVLLISVTERTFEIGLRKAVGAKRKDIMLLFLSESITISALGSGLGLIFGILSTFAIVPIIKAIMNLPVAFEASYTWNTLMIIASIAVLVGIIFGTYPALRASRLSPVDAIRRE